MNSLLPRDTDTGSLLKYCATQRSWDCQNEAAQQDLWSCLLSLLTKIDLFLKTCTGAERWGWLLNNPFLSRLLIITGMRTIPGAAIPILKRHQEDINCASFMLFTLFTDSEWPLIFPPLLLQNCGQLFYHLQSPELFPARRNKNNRKCWASSWTCVSSNLLIRGMLMQFAALQARKGTSLPTSGGRLLTESTYQVNIRYWDVAMPCI